MSGFDTAGYKEDSLGRLVPIDRIKPVDLTRDGLVGEVLAKWKKMRDALKAFKEEISGDIDAFVQMSSEQYGVSLGGKKGNIQLTSYDGRLKLVVAVSNAIGFDEQLQAAKALIDSCAARWTEGSRSEVKAIINDAFQVDREGNLSVGRILSLRRLDIQDPEWLQAMEAISNSIRVVGSKSYMRAYERDGNGKYAAIPLDLAAL